MSEIEAIFDNFTCQICFRKYNTFYVPIIICIHFHVICNECYAIIKSDNDKSNVNFFYCPFCKTCMKESETIQFRQLFDINDAMLVIKTRQKGYQQQIELLKVELTSLKSQNQNLKGYLRSTEIMMSKVQKIENEVEKLNDLGTLQRKDNEKQKQIKQFQKKIEKHFRQVIQRLKIEKQVVQKQLLKKLEVSSPGCKISKDKQPIQNSIGQNRNDPKIIRKNGLQIEYLKTRSESFHKPTKSNPRDLDTALSKLQNKVNRHHYLQCNF